MLRKRRGITAPKPDRGDVTSLRPPVGRHRRHLDRIIALVQAEAVHIPEIKIFPLAEAKTAQAISEGRHFRGKLVLQMRGA